MDVTAARPRTVEIAVYILTAAFVVGIASSVVDLLALPDQRIVAGLMLIIIAMILFNLYKIWVGRNWARILYSILFVLGCFMSIPQLFVTFNTSIMSGLVDAGLLALQVVALAMLYLAQATRGSVRMASNRSLERTVPTPRAVPAVPLLGCTAGTSTNGFRAAAQFNR